MTWHRIDDPDHPPPISPRRALISTTAPMSMDDLMTLAHFTYGPGARIDLGNKPGEW